MYLPNKPGKQDLYKNHLNLVFFTFKLDCRLQLIALPSYFIPANWFEVEVYQRKFYTKAYDLEDTPA